MNEFFKKYSNNVRMGKKMDVKKSPILVIFFDFILINVKSKIEHKKREAS